MTLAQHYNYVKKKIVNVSVVSAKMGLAFFSPSNTYICVHGGRGKNYSLQQGKISVSSEAQNSKGEDILQCLSTARGGCNNRSTKLHPQCMSIFFCKGCLLDFCTSLDGTFSGR